MRHLTDRGGQPLELHRPAGLERGIHAGVTIRTEADDIMGKTVDKDGVYEKDGGRFFIAAGDPLPDGAEVVAEPVEDAAPENDGDNEERAKDAAPENKAKQAAPENRAKKGE